MLHVQSVLSQKCITTFAKQRTWFPLFWHHSPVPRNMIPASNANWCTASVSVYINASFVDLKESWSGQRALLCFITRGLSRVTVWSLVCLTLQPDNITHTLLSGTVWTLNTHCTHIQLAYGISSCQDDSKNILFMLCHKLNSRSFEMELDTAKRRILNTKL